VPVDGSGVLQPVISTDGALVTIGAKADAKNSATDTTAITMMQVLKQISYQLQQEQPTIINKFKSVEGTTSAGGTVDVDIDTSSFTKCYEIEIINKTGNDAIQYTVGTTSSPPSTPDGTNCGFLPAGGVPSAITLPNNTVAASIRVKLKCSSAITYAVNAKGA
jgi:hypothetical protein